MTETRDVSIEDVRTLVGERQRYDDWLTALEARRAETPARVFERVHGDYAARRAAVMEQLRSHVGTLGALADDLDAKLGALDADLASLEDERVEAMLRTAVGEFDDDRWEQVRRDVESKIGDRTAERSALTVEADDVRTLLSSARSEPLPVGSAGAGPQHQATPHAESAPGDGGTHRTPIDVPVDVPALSTTEVQSSEVLSNDALDIEDALAMFTPGGPAGSGTATDTAGIDVIERPAPALAGAASGAAAETFDDLAFLRSVIDPAEATRAPQSANASAAPSEPQKTLRCTECGTMNLPTEWYCERCGGELAAF